MLPRGGNYMPLHWKDDDQIYLLDAMEDYRKAIEGKGLKEAKGITLQFAETT